MKIFQGKQADQIEAKVEQLEVALRVRTKGPIEERMAAVVIATTQLVMKHKKADTELRRFRRLEKIANEALTELGTILNLAKGKQ